MRRKLIILTVLMMLAFSACGNQAGENGGDPEGYREGSQIEEIGLSLEVKKIKDTGATLVFRQSGGNPAGELSFGSYSIERYENEEWVEVPVVVKGQYAFTLLGHLIALEDDTKCKLDWEWLYGELSSGEYRIGMRVSDRKGIAGYDEYMIYGYFEL